MLTDRLEGVTVCVEYSDFLRETLPYNMRHFDRYLVITKEGDHDTIGLCRKLGVDYLTTNLMTKGDQFAKSRGIDYGIANLTGDGWVIHVDADIWLPPQTRHLISHVSLDPKCIYGIDRVNCIGWDNWKKFISMDPHLEEAHQFLWHCLIVPPPFPLGGRLSFREYGGYVPIGFFQMWHHGQCPKRYPLNHSGAERTDVLHALQWEPENRRLLPELVAVHLESEKSELGKNWNGRKSMKFGPHHHQHEKHHEHHQKYCD
jgi:hypothetical protein